MHPKRQELEGVKRAEKDGTICPIASVIDLSKISAKKNRLRSNFRANHSNHVSSIQRTGKFLKIPKKNCPPKSAKLVTVRRRFAASLCHLV